MSRTATATTWLSLSATVLVLALAAYLAMSDRTVKPNTMLPPPSPTGSEVAPPAELESTAAAEIPQSPYDIAKEMVDAGQRSKIWSNEACLTEIRVVSQEGKRVVVDLTYAEATGRAFPGAPVSAKRIQLSYDASGLASKKEDSSGPSGVCLPEPNCPLQAAIFAAGQAGAETSKSAGGVYLRSTKYDRPVWTISAPGQPLFHVDGDNCALLRR